MCWTEDVCHEAWEGAHGLDGKKKFGVQNKTKSTKVKNSGREAIGGGAARSRSPGTCSVWLRSTLLNFKLISGLIMAWPGVLGFVVAK